MYMAIDYYYCCCLMDETLSREEKRRLKKKERKRKIRQVIAENRIQRIENEEIKDELVAMNSPIPMNSLHETNSEKKSLVPKSICEKCQQRKTKYLCNDCSMFYCEMVFVFRVIDNQCYNQIHKELQKEKNEFHMDCEEILLNNAEELLKHNDSDKLSQGFNLDKQISKPKIQHNGLRCKKCFELLVHNDEFLYYS